MLALAAACGGALRGHPRGHGPQADQRSRPVPATPQGTIRLSRNDREVVLSWCNMRDERTTAFFEKSLAMGILPRLSPRPTPNCGELSYPLTAGFDGLLEGLVSILAVVAVREAALGNPIALDLEGLSDAAQAYLRATLNGAKPVSIRIPSTRTEPAVPSAMGANAAATSPVPRHWELSIDSEEDCTLPLLALGARWMPPGDPSLPLARIASTTGPAGPARTGTLRSSIRFPIFEDHAALIARIRQNSLPFDPWFALSLLADAGAISKGDAWSTLLDEKRIPADAAEVTRLAARCFGNPWTLQVWAGDLVWAAGDGEARVDGGTRPTAPEDGAPLSPQEQRAADTLANALRSTVVAMRPAYSAPSSVALPHFGMFSYDGALRFIFAAIGSQSHVAGLRAKMTDPESKERNRAAVQGTPQSWNARVIAVQSTRFFDNRGNANAWHVLEFRPSAPSSERELSRLLFEVRTWISMQRARSDLTREESALLDESNMRILLFRPKLPEPAHRPGKKTAPRKQSPKKLDSLQAGATP